MHRENKIKGESRGPGVGKTVKDLQGQGLSLNRLPSAADAWEDGD